MNTPHQQQPSPRAVEQSSKTTRLHYSPNVDICDAGREVTLVADLPGAKPEEIDIRYDDGILTLHAPVASRPLPGRMLRHEYGVGDYRRSFQLGEGFDPVQITAEARDGVLTIHVPRTAAAQPRKIAVTSA
jgi:HSP20 family protein